MLTAMAPTNDEIEAGTDKLVTFYAPADLIADFDRLLGEVATKYTSRSDFLRQSLESGVALMKKRIDNPPS